MTKLEFIKKRVEEETGADLSSRSRKRDLVIARCIYSKLAVEHTFLSLEKIGKEIDRAHDMIIHYVKVLPMHLRYERDFRNLYHQLDAEVRRTKAPDDEKAAIYQFLDNVPQKKYKQVLEHLELMEL